MAQEGLSHPSRTQGGFFFVRVGRMLMDYPLRNVEGMCISCVWNGLALMHPKTAAEAGAVALDLLLQNVLTASRWSD